MGTVIATFSTWVSPTVHVNKGDSWDASDPVVRDHPDWFTNDPAELERLGLLKHSDTSVGRRAEVVVEQATADPGEKRSAPRAARG